jgi:hypothetical protein
MHSFASTCRIAVLLAAAIPFVGKPTLSALTFNFTNGGSVPADYMTAAVAAGNLWSGFFTDPITINVTITYGAPTSTAVADSTAASGNFGYAIVRQALLSDAISADDLSSAANLQNASSADFLINRTSNGAGILRMDLGNAGSSLDDNNKEVVVPRAVQKALGLDLEPLTGQDGTISLFTGRNYDTDRSNGIDVTGYDLIGVLAHELGHILGFQSAAELLSVSGAFITEASVKPRIGDLFRFSAESTGASGSFTGAGTGIFDISADTRPKYFSVNGGTSSVAEFARGSSSTISGFGNGQQANHWLNSATPIGLMDPTIGLGELLSFTSTDLRFFDVIGFNPVPEGRGWAAGCMLLLGAGLLRWRKHAA